MIFYYYKTPSSSFEKLFIDNTRNRQTTKLDITQPKGLNPHDKVYRVINN